MLHQICGYGMFSVCFIRRGTRHVQRVFHSKRYTACSACVSFEEVHGMFSVCFIRRGTRHVQRVFHSKRYTACSACVSFEEVHGMFSVCFIRRGTRHVQRVFHSKRYDDLKKNLNVFIDEHGLFPCRGRFGNSSLPYENKYPILLPTDSLLTVLLIQDAHKSVLHNVHVRQLTKLDVNTRYQEFNKS